MMMKMYLVMVMKEKKERYLGVVQDTPVLVRVAFVISTCNQNFSRLNHFRAAAVRERELGECFEEVDVDVEADIEVDNEVEEDEK